MTLALNLAQALNCEATEPPCGECNSCRKIASAKHADVQIIGLGSSGNSEGDKNRAEIGIDRIREMQSSASLPPFEGSYKVFIVDGAEHLSLEAANCLLKTLEEPVGRVVFVLLATSDTLLPATVVSRCQRLELSPLSAKQVEAALSQRGVEPQKAKLLIRLCRGCLGWAILSASDDALLQQRAERLEKLLEILGAGYEVRFVHALQMSAQFSQSREPVYDILNTWLDWWRDLLLIKTGCKDAIINIDFEATLVEQAGDFSLAEIREVIERLQTTGEQLKQNVSSQLALGALMLAIPRRKEQRQESLSAALK
jgi:DNA polymerase-3 subunit delta'